MEKRPSDQQQLPDEPARAALRSEALTLFRQETFRQLMRDGLTEEEEHLLEETDPEKLREYIKGSMESLEECLEELGELGVELTPRELREISDPLLSHAGELVQRRKRLRRNDQDG